MITKNSVVKIQNLVMNCESQPIKVLEYLQKTKFLKMIFFLGQFYYWTEAKTKCFLTKMFLNQISFALTFLKSNSITFCFSLSLT